MVKDFPLSPLEKLARKVGAERISSDALEEMRSTLLEISDRVAADAVAACHHARRVTVKREDVRMAAR